jgi:hypothetical protein
MTIYDNKLKQIDSGIFYGNIFFQFEIEQTKNGHAFLLCPLFKS